MGIKNILQELNKLYKNNKFIRFNIILIFYLFYQ